MLCHKAQVGPSEVASHHADIRRLFQDTEIHRDVGIRREALLHVGILRLHAELRILLVVVTEHRWQYLAEALTQIAYIAQEEARVPIELATLYEDLGEITLRLLGKRLHMIDVVAADIAHLNVSVSWFRAGRLHTHGQEMVVLGYESQALQYILAESLLVEDGLVGRCGDDTGIRVHHRDAMVGLPRRLPCCDG